MAELLVVPGSASFLMSLDHLSAAWQRSAAASLSVTEQYMSAFSKLAKDSNTVLLPANTSDITHMVAQVSVGGRTLPLIRG